MIVGPKNDEWHKCYALIILEHHEPKLEFLTLQSMEKME